MRRKDAQLAKVIAAAYERVIRRNKGSATKSQVREEGRDEIANIVAGTDYIEEILDALVEKEDRRRIAQGNDAQLDLLSGEERAFEGMWALGDGRRVQKKYVVEDDYIRHLQVKGKANADSNKAWKKDQREAEALLPLMRGGKVTLPEAVTKWRQENGKQ